VYIHGMHDSTRGGTGSNKRTPQGAGSAAISKALPEADAATYIGWSRSYLRHERMRPHGGNGPPFIRVGRSIRYLVADLDAWLTWHRVGDERRLPAGEAAGSRIKRNRRG
jgi:hypothetical protein